MKYGDRNPTLALWCSAIIHQTKRVRSDCEWTVSCRHLGQCDRSAGCLRDVGTGISHVGFPFCPRENGFHRTSNAHHVAFPCGCGALGDCESVLPSSPLDSKFVGIPFPLGGQPPIRYLFARLGEPLFYQGHGQICSRIARRIGGCQCVQKIARATSVRWPWRGFLKTNREFLRVPDGGAPPRIAG